MNCSLDQAIASFLPRRQASEVSTTLATMEIFCTCDLAGKRIPAFVITDQSVANPVAKVAKLHDLLQKHGATIVR